MHIGPPQGRQAGRHSALLLAVAISCAVISAGQSPPTKLRRIGKPIAAEHDLFAGVWRTDSGLSSTLEIHNVAVTVPLPVSITLFMADGTRAQLPQVVLAPRGDAEFDLASALAQVQSDLGSHLSQFGSAELSYVLDSPSHLTGSIEIRGEGFGYSETFAPATELEAVPHIDPLFLKNAAGQAQLAAIQAGVASRNAPKAVMPRGPPYQMTLHLDAGAARELDVAALAAANPRDSSGVPFPAIGSGSAGIESAAMPQPNANGVRLVPRGGTPYISLVINDDFIAAPGAANPGVDLAPVGPAGRAGLRLHPDYEDYGCGYVDAWVDSDTGPLAVGNALSYTLFAQDCDYVNSNISPDATWQGDSTYGSINTNGSGRYYAANAGTGTLDANDVCEWWQVDEDPDDPPFGDLEFYCDGFSSRTIYVYPTISGNDDIWWFGGYDQSGYGYNMEDDLYTDYYGDNFYWQIDVN